MADLLADLRKFQRNIPMIPLHPNKCEVTWSLQDGGIMPGFIQVKGLGPVTAPALVARREELGGFKGYKDVQSVRGVGPKTVEAIQAFRDDPDPFRVVWLQEKLEEMRAELDAGIGDGSGFYTLPVPTHKASEISYERTPRNVNVTWLGVVRGRNLKDLFEAHHSKTGQHLDREKVKDPHLNEWVVMYCEDETDVVTVTVDRWRYRKFKDLIWELREGQDLVLFRGYKMGIQARRAIYVTDMWILETEEEL